MRYLPMVVFCLVSCLVGLTGSEALAGVYAGNPPQARVVLRPGKPSVTLDQAPGLLDHLELTPCEGGDPIVQVVELTADFVAEVEVDLEYAGICDVKPVFSNLEITGLFDGELWTWTGGDPTVLEPDVLLVVESVE